MTDFPEVTEARVVHVEPGDVIWLRVDSRMTAEKADRILEAAVEVWPHNKVVVGQEIDVAIVRHV